jgi:tetratricopeptide (TPR) repeat protein
MEVQEKENTGTVEVIETPTYNKPALADLFNKNQKLITYVLGGLIVAILGFFAYKYFYLQPMQEEAEKKIFKAERYFDSDSIKLALNGDGNNPGFLEIAEDYGSTKAGNRAHYYIGVIYLQQGKYQDAIDNLKDFKADSKILMPVALGAIGDAYSQLKNYDEAADYYINAAKEDANEFTAPRYYKKAGIVYEELGKYKEAADAYQKIKEKYPRSQEGNMIDKYIARAKAGSGSN